MGGIDLGTPVSRSQPSHQICLFWLSNPRRGHWLVGSLTGAASKCNGGVPAFLRWIETHQERNGKREPDCERDISSRWDNQVIVIRLGPRWESSLNNKSSGDNRLIPPKSSHRLRAGLDVGSSHPGAGAGPGMAVRHLSDAVGFRTSWDSSVYLPWALRIERSSSLVREDRDGQTLVLSCVRQSHRRVATFEGITAESI